MLLLLPLNFKVTFVDIQSDDRSIRAAAQKPQLSGSNREKSNPVHLLSHAEMTEVNAPTSQAVADVKEYGDSASTPAAQEPDHPAPLAPKDNEEKEPKRSIFSHGTPIWKKILSQVDFFDELILNDRNTPIFCVRYGNTLLCSDSRCICCKDPDYVLVSIHFHIHIANLLQSYPAFEDRTNEQRAILRFICSTRRGMRSFHFSPRVNTQIINYYELFIRFLK
jgi:hypothetical protein